MWWISALVSNACRSYQLQCLPTLQRLIGAWSRCCSVWALRILPTSLQYNSLCLPGASALWAKSCIVWLAVSIAIHRSLLRRHQTAQVFTDLNCQSRTSTPLFLLCALSPTSLLRTSVLMAQVVFGCTYVCKPITASKASECGTNRKVSLPLQWPSGFGGRWRPGWLREG